nr:immunoglobulin heavy chain junction region [Macaca mulatta]
CARLGSHGLNFGYFDFW